MLILTLRTDQPEAEISLYDDERQLAYRSWQAHRQLAETIHGVIKDMLDGQDKSLNDLQGLAIYKGPGSFTGLRIGFSVANAWADSLEIPIVSETGNQWVKKSLQRLTAGQDERLALPDYGSEPKTTTQKK